MSETKQIQGACQGILEDGSGWVEFQINIGRQYPVRLKTKRDEIIAEGRAAGVQGAVWTYNESEGNPNPHKPGTNYKNRYLEKVEVGGQLAPVAPAGQTQIQVPAGGTVTQVGPTTQDNWLAERRSIERQTIVKAMVPYFPPTKDPDEWWGLMALLDHFMVSGVKPLNAEAAPQVAQTGTTESPDEDPDDIPF